MFLEKNKRGLLFHELCCVFNSLCVLFLIQNISQNCFSLYLIYNIYIYISIVTQKIWSSYMIEWKEKKS